VACLTIDRTAADAQGHHAYHDQASDDAEAKSADVIARVERPLFGRPSDETTAAFGCVKNRIGYLVHATVCHTKTAD
jgi:hypothetical protein